MTANVWNPGQGAIPVAQSKQTMLSQVFTAVANQQLFNLTAFNYEPSTSSLIVAINGAVQRPTVDVAETSSSSFTVDTPLKAGDLVLALGFVGVTATDASLTAIANTTKGYRDNALTYSQNSANSATAASNSATAASTSETNANTAKTDAQTAAANANASYNNTVSQSASALNRFRNKLINGDFQLDQRYAGTVTVTSNSAFFADKWKSQTIGSTLSSQRLGLPVALLSDTNGELSVYSRHVVTSVAAVGNIARIMQGIENVRTFAGKTITVSFLARCDVAGSISVECAQVFGTGGSPSAAVVGLGTKIAIGTGTFQKYSASFAIPSLAGKTLGANGDHYLEFSLWLDAGANFNNRTQTLGQQNISLDITDIQIEAGTVATEFERRLFAQEQMLAQRYFQRFTNCKSWGYTTAGNAYGWTFPLIVPMRASPSVAFSNITYVNASGLTAEQITFNTVSMYYLITTAAAANAIFNVEFNADYV